MADDTHSNDYAPIGEESGVNATFSADAVATAFEVEIDRVHRAMAGEFGQADTLVNSRQAQLLAEVLLGDQPQDQQIAALMTLGAYTPRSDHTDGLGEKDPADESDRLVRNADEDDGERG
ncbi:MAG TPA: hypothetical protein VEW66_04930 [Thermomicrobiales bacterium]|nr:hypothetical protein [Thermomicrobiales bacterium]